MAYTFNPFSGNFDDKGASANGWSPILAVVADGARRVLQVASWTGGSGAMPASGDYVGPTGLEPLIANGVDIRGPVGAGSGDVSGPLTSTVNAIAVWGDVNGDTLKDSLIVVDAATGDIIINGSVLPNIGRRTDVNMLLLHQLTLGTAVVGIGDSAFNFGISLGLDTPLSWTDGSPASTQDVKLFRGGAAGVLEQRVGTSPQKFHVLNTWSGAGANYERGVMEWVANDLKIGSFHGGTGASRVVLLCSGNATVMTLFGSLVVMAVALQTKAHIVEIRVVTTTAAISGDDYYLSCVHATVAFTVTLPNAATSTGRVLKFKNKGAAAVTLDATGLGQIFGTAAANTLVLATGDMVTLTSDGTIWLVGD